MCQTTGCCRGGRTFVCFTCRLTAKALDSGRDYRLTPADTNKTEHPVCPRCRQPMTNLGIKVAVPRKTADRKWRQLEQRFWAP